MYLLYLYMAFREYGVNKRHTCLLLVGGRNMGQGCRDINKGSDK